MAKQPQFRSWLLLVLCGLTLGCGDGRHVVKGRILFEGQPVAEAAVLFVPDTGAPGQAQTDAEGYYTLSCANEPGMPPGTYRVAISKYTVQGAPKAADDGLAGGKVGTVIWVVPERYSLPEKSGLTATVPGGKYDFSLTK